jgi:hypothetical protein
VAKSIGAPIPQVRAPGSCSESGACGEFVNIDGNLTFQAAGGSTGDNPGFCPVVNCNSGETPGTTAWRVRNHRVVTFLPLYFRQ